MIYTNEPANVFYVLVSAARANLSDIANMGRQLDLKALLQAEPDYYGVLECTGLTGCYFEQDCVMVYKSQTHTAGLMFCKGLDGYRTTRLNGSFQQVDAPKGECFTKDAEGRFWEVV